jgi:hypothetical protein
VSIIIVASCCEIPSSFAAIGALMDARSPTHELVRAHEVLTARRRIADSAPEWAATVEGLAILRGKRTRDRAAGAEPRQVDDENDEEFALHEDGAAAGEFGEIDALLARTASIAPSHDVHGLIYDEDWDEVARLSEWRRDVEATRHLPPLLAAGVALDAWEAIEPLQHRPWLGPLLVASLLRARGKTRHHLAALHAGFRRAKYRRSGQSDLASRLIGFARAVETMAHFDTREIDRLTLARELLVRKCQGRRANSKLPRLAELCLTSPIVSVPLAAKELNIAQQAATIMIGELSSNLRELTGRGRYRAWAVM